MHKIQGLTGSARHGWDRMTPSAINFGMQRQQPPDSITAQTPASNLFPKRASDIAPTRQTAPRYNPLNLSFNVPFSSNLGGPDVDDIIHATPGAFDRWTHPEGADEDTPIHLLPVHVENVENLKSLCRHMSDSSEGRLQASVTTSKPRQIPGLQVPSVKTLVTNVCLAGDAELVKRMRGRILTDTPISLRCAIVDIDQHLASDVTTGAIRASVLEHMDYLAGWTGTNIFLLKPRSADVDTLGFNGTLDNNTNPRFRIAIYGDMESSDHAKTRTLIMIDQILKRKVDVCKLELSMHTMICGRLRRHIKQIESVTNTAIYFPPPFPQLYGYTPPTANRRRDDEIFITGENAEDIFRAKSKLHDLARSTQACVKEIRIAPDKIDSILLERLDKIRKIMEYNGSYVLFPQLGLQRGLVRVQATDMLHVERTIRDIMTISGQFYAATWWVTLSDSNQRTPTATDIRAMLADICVSSGAEVSFEKLTFNINGSDDAVKAALWFINQLPFTKRIQSQLRVRIELANEHKEFVSGKKNGKINKIMSQSNVQVYFDLFNEYNFFIDVSGSSYDATKNGLDLVEQEMPASIAFHVPDQYHKRIIGIGGQHIQRIMKKYSVFVKFSNAMDRGGLAKEDDDIKVDNVICRTPARNAQSLDMVKTEIMELVEKPDADVQQEPLQVPRLYHRELLARLPELEELEKKWNCKIIFPSTEQASDSVTVLGPEYQIPQAIDELLGMIPNHRMLKIDTNEQLAAYFVSADFAHEIVGKLRSQYEVDLQVEGLSSAAAADDAVNTQTEVLTLSYTRNNAGALKDAIDFLITSLVAHGLDAASVRGGIPRPKSDSFEDTLRYFDARVLHPASASETSLVLPTTESPTRSVFGDNATTEPGSRGSLLSRIRKPSTIPSLGSFLDRRKNASRSPATGLGGLAGHGSSNASKVSLASIESQTSNYRNPWNDSGVNLAEDDGNGGWPARFGSVSGPSTGSGLLEGIQSPFGASNTSLHHLGGHPTVLPPPASKTQTQGDSTPRSDYHMRMSPDAVDSPGDGQRRQPGPIGRPQ